MAATFEPLRMYGGVSDATPLDWGWADERLAAAGLYWVSVPTIAAPHPRPVWGLWTGERLHLSIGTPTFRRAVPGSPITVHLESAAEVVIVEGVIGGTADDAALVAAYDAKYPYDLEQHGPFVTVDVARVLAWRTAGRFGRGGFVATGSWRFG